MEPDSLTPPKRSMLDIGFMIFLRLVALACLVFGIQYWGLLTGYLLDGRARFDLLNLPWRVAGSALAVLFPVAALGLWLTVSWGPVVWLIAAGGQLVMYTVWPEIFGTNWLIVALNGAIMAVFAVLRTLLFLRRRRMRQVRSDSP
ncbi:DUF6163 family protein [Gellertiella hungarica]|uniref:Integral membrane protein n=1 Tax=Gellertiella hungarica TaxID=1572859 RepID=A0A7W6J660_9HYPH|nr:DUF6163 family protein [Gellertiella hungarica]MBB4065503.1 hypothetical protein [Gellertiella hungarica]